MKTSKGRIVHYRVGPYDCIGSVKPERVGEIRAAIIVEDWGGQEDADAGCRPNLLVFPDGGNDGQRTVPGVQPLWLTSVPFNPTAMGCWFWPPRG